MAPTARFSCRRSLFALLLFALSSQIVTGQLTGLPDLHTITVAPGAPTSAKPQPTNTKGGTNTDGGQNTQPDGSDPTATSVPSDAVPVLVVPDTANAPFMQKSNLPEGTVFICVGAVLGFLGAAVLAWRGLVAWSLHRSVKRAASRQYASESKSSYRGGSTYPNTYNSSSMSLEHLAASKSNFDSAAGDARNASQRTSRHYKDKSRSASRNASRNASRRNSRQPAPNAAGLFFSPTAAGMQNAQQRSSSYLPAGYYASGASATSAGNAITQMGGAPNPGYMRVVDSHTPSPPLSPGLPPDYAGRGREPSPYTDRPRVPSMMPTNRGSLSVPHSRNTSAHVSNRNSLHINSNHPPLPGQHPHQPQARAPSAYLDDVLSLHGSAMSER